MCRFLIFKGKEPILLAHLLTRPAHSIINQSFDSRLRLDMTRPINGDGFGVGYYTMDRDLELDAGPCVFCAITPAWNNTNLARLANKTKSDLVFAHVRASTSGTLSETNCHPFAYHNFMFMHNGNLSGFSKIKTRLVRLMDEEYFNVIEGGTDSEWAFALFLDTLNKLGCDPARTDIHHPHAKIREAIIKTIEIIKEVTKSVGVTESEPSLLNFAVTDGETVVCSRYITSKTEEAASLHFSSGSSFFEYKPGQYRMERHDKSQNIIMVASEPLTFERGDWITIPTNTIVTLTNQNVLLHPVIDEYYVKDPSHRRSSALAESKGLASPVHMRNNPPGVPPLGREGRDIVEEVVA
ncbi:putative glutamine amidotransferase DUG3 [Yarrowia sp. B02]|nr:putative glutamine amidotransferase DUG3 [Yarrowia sp. B02]